MPKGKKDDKPIAEEKFQQVEVNAKDPRTVVLMLDSPEIGIICKACQALQQYMEKSEQNCIELQTLGVLPRLVALLDSPDKVVRACAVVTLAVMVPNLSVKRILLKLKCIPPLLKMLKPDEEVYIVERASYITYKLADEYTFKQHLVEEGACQLLIPLLSHTDCDVLKNSVTALSLLTNHHTARTAIANENGFPLLLTQLDSEYTEVQDLVLHTLEHCLHDATCRASFSGAEGLSKITEFLNKKEWDDLHVLAVDVLSLCLMEDKGMEALHSSNCLQKLLESIRNSQIPQMKTKATKALASASRDEVSQKILHEQEAEKVFIELLSSQDESVCIAACEALRGLSTLTSGRQYIGQEGGVKSLSSLLQHTSEGVRTAAVQTLASVINEAIANSNLVSEAGGIEGLVNLLSDENALSRLFAAQCMITMSQSGALRLELVEHGAMEGLAGCLSHADSKVLSAAAQTLALLGIDSTARDKFPAESICHLLDMLLSADTEVCHNSAWALAVLAQRRCITEAVFRTKGVDTLQKLSRESPHREVREYGKLALKRLLAGSPAAKYCITKTLSPQDTIVGIEFWDMGMAEARGFVPLEEIVNQSAKLNRPVITVSLVNKPLPPQPVVLENEEEHRGKEDLETSSNRSKSRQMQHNSRESSKGTGKKISKEKQAPEQHPEEDGGSLQEAGVGTPQGLLPPDPGIWEHVTYVQTNIKNLETVKKQAERLAVYVSQSMGGPLTQGTAIQYELPLAEIQATTQTSLVPIGVINKGTYQHRALLYKVLADQLGIPCSLYRGQYGRHWNTVVLEQKEFLVDLVFTPSKLWSNDSQEACQYQTI